MPLLALTKKERMPEAYAIDDELRGHLKRLVEAQRSGKYAPAMGFARQQGLKVWAKPVEGGDEEVVCEGITTEQLRALGAAGLLSVTTPRSYWRLRLRPAAFEAVDAA